MQLEISQDERAERAQAVQARLTRLTEIHTKLRRLNAALANLSVAPRKKQLALVASATRYVEEMEPPPGVKPLLTAVRNELRSLDEGIRADIIPASDMLLTSGVRAIKGVEELAAKAVANVQRLKASGPMDQDEALIRKNQKLKEQIPAFNGREFVVGRAPAAFTFANTQKHSSVGYVNPELLEQQGFKTDNLGGYTIIHNQLVIGIDAHAVYKKLTDPDDPTRKPELVRLKVKDDVIKFSGGKPKTVKQAREKKHIDLARNVMKMVERQWNTKYAFVSEQSVSLNGGEFFWVMPAADLVRLARAFPGGHVKIDKWGFAF